MFSFLQDETSRDLSIAADNMTRDGAPRIAKAPQVFYPGSWSAQTAYKNRLEFENGDYCREHADSVWAGAGRNGGRGFLCLGGADQQRECGYRTDRRHGLVDAGTWRTRKVLNQIETAGWL